MFQNCGNLNLRTARSKKSGSLKSRKLEKMCTIIHFASHGIDGADQTFQLMSHPIDLTVYNVKKIA